MLVGIKALTVYYITDFVELYNSYKASNAHYQWPELADLKIAAAVAAVLVLMRVIFHNLMVNWAFRIMSQKYSEEERWIRAGRLVVQILKAAFYTYSFIAGYLICRHAFWFPTYFGGSGSASLFLANWPYQDNSSAPYLKFYVLTELGFHFHALVAHWFEPIKKNFIEMVFHHVVTVLLILLAYFLNFHAAAALVMFSHDLSDIFVCITRAFFDTTYTKVVLGSYVMIMVTWVLTRLLFFIGEMVWPVYTKECMKGIVIPGYDAFFGLIFSLTVLNVFWFYKLAEMGFLYATKKEYSDTVEGVTRYKKQV